MATINCPTTLECPALPRVTLSQAVIDLMESIALQESALSHILCAESQKMKTALAMNEIDLCKLLEVNDCHQHGARRGKSGAGAEGKAGVYLQ